MRVDLRSLQPDPMRDFTIDPMDPETVERLRQSIEEDGFWGGVVCRTLPAGTFQIGAGHHRVAAALAAGITEVDLYVAKDRDDVAMIRVYARENATQRGMSSTALTGRVASALKYVAKCILTGTGVAEKFLCNFDMPTVRRRLLGEGGMGRDVILFACGANIHGKPRTHDDKRRAVTRLLQDAEWEQWSDSEIAKHCGVSHKTVATRRCEWRASWEIPKIGSTRTVQRNGTVYPMNTSASRKHAFARGRPLSPPQRGGLKPKTSVRSPAPRTLAHVARDRTPA